MSLPPLANLFAVHDPDPRFLDSLEGDLRNRGDFAEVWRPAIGWVAASNPLPHGASDGEDVRGNGLAFAEGRDGLSSAVNDPRQRFREIAEMTDSSPERLACLPGDFTFIRFRPHGCATAVRACAGLVPLYFRRTGNRVAMGTLLGYFVRYLPGPSALDPLVNAVWTVSQCCFPDGRTFVTGVSAVARGEFLCIDPEKPQTTRRYWDPRPSELPRATEARTREDVERLRRLLFSRLEGDLHPDGGNLLTLSGGVDSSALAAVAAGALGFKISTWSLLPGAEWPELRQREISYIERLAQKFGFERRWELSYHPETAVRLLQMAPPALFHIIHPALCSLPGILREAEVRVLFGGEFADEVCGSVMTLVDWARHVSPWRLLLGTTLPPTGPRDLLRCVKHRLLSAVGRPMLPVRTRLPDFIRPEVHREHREWMDRVRRVAGRDPRPWRHLELCFRQMGEFVTMNWEATSVLGVRRCLPFFNREIFELAFGCRPSELVGPGTKKILRAALRDCVPRENLERADKGQWEGSFAELELPWEASLPASLSNVVAEAWFRKPPAMVDNLVAFQLSDLVRFADFFEATQALSESTWGLRRQE